MEEGEEVAFDVAGNGAIIALEYRREDRVCLGLNVIDLLDSRGSEVGEAELLSVSDSLFERTLSLAYPLELSSSIDLLYGRQCLFNRGAWIGRM